MLTPRNILASCILNLALIVLTGFSLLKSSDMVFSGGPGLWDILSSQIKNTNSVAIYGSGGRDKEIVVSFRDFFFCSVSFLFPHLLM